MFATGLPATAMGFFSAASFVIALPERVMYFAWIAHDVGRQGDASHTPMLFALGFLLIFLLGGITGVMVAALPFDLQVTDSYFIVAHFHYVLNGAVVFPIFGAIYYWMPKMTGRAARASGSAGGASGRCSSASTSRSSRCTSSGFWAWPGGSTPTTPGSAGTRST